jgi:dihydroorotase
MAMPMSLMIENGRVYLKGRLVRKNVFIEDGKISKITPKKIQSDEKLDAKNKIVMPGAIDPHVHFREPGLTHKEDFQTGSFAAAAGGTTCIIDMPNTKPPTLTSHLLMEKGELAAQKSVVNFGFHFGSSTENIDDIKEAKGVASVKIFMNASTGNMLITDENAIRKIIDASRIATFHAEDENAKKALDIAASLGKKFYLCHACLKNEIDYVKQNGKKNVFTEVTPHHLFLTEKNQNKYVIMKPTLKSDADRKSLWSALNDGTIDTIGSDHAPHTLEEKATGEVYGVPGVETRMPLMLDAVNRRMTTLRRLAETMCENPAKIFRLKNKGFINEGFDADLTIIDMKLKKKVRNDGLFTKCGWSPFEGFELRGWPVVTIVNGGVVFKNGEITSKNRGRMVQYE